MEPKERERIRQALFWQGFGVLGSDCFVHPSADLTAAFNALVAEGLGDQLDKLMPLLAADSRSGLSANDADLVRRAWNLEALAEAYAGVVAAYLPILAELRRDRQAEVDAESAFLLRTLLIHGARAALPSLARSETPLGRWLTGMIERGVHRNAIVVALANKLARIAWAALRKDATFERGYPVAA